MEVQPVTLDNGSEADAYLTDLLKKPEFQSMDVIEQRGAALIKDPAVKTYFLSKGAAMLADLKGRS